ncbi:MAG TPA: aminotransferase class III-fold pyridoxal phosphate-dependent enzyme, partial [Acidimicrobiales bacterium]|nr:aminotransferase class III-fold pyridoxal phosphate-dependent enzyme [Acidimicrobiales bacterium]
PGDHGSTFGGQPLASAAALAVLRVMEREDAPGRAHRAGERLTAALRALPEVESVRGAGLLLGAELVAGLDARAVVADALARGLVVNAVRPTTVRLAPSLLVSDEHLDEAASILAVALTTVADRTGAGEHGGASA